LKARTAEAELELKVLETRKQAAAKVLAAYQKQLATAEARAQELKGQGRKD
jgi:hypothetical protein